LNALPIKGRGALSNRDSRFSEHSREAVDDGWQRDDGDERPPVEVITDAARSIITHNDSPDVPFDRSINPYRGCAHGCIYCFARPSHAYLGLSPGLDFETRIAAKPNAAALLRKELAKPGYRPQTIALGANTDPYQPLERELGITRQLLEVFRDTRHPVTLITKSDRVLRDLDLLAELAADGLTGVLISVTTLDPELARRMEPRAVSPRKRLAAIERLSRAGVPCGVLYSPVIPGLNDADLERVLEAAAAAGAERANMILLRLPREIAELFSEWLTAHYPERTNKVLNLLRQCRGGELNITTFGERMRGNGPVAQLLQRRFELCVKRLGLDTPKEGWDLSCDRFTPPGGAQLSLEF
jgi:DNA repair photolyase